MKPYFKALGQSSYQQNDALQQLSSTRPVLLCAYLSVQADWVARDAIISLFWAEDSEKSARNKLRQLVYKTKKQPLAASLELSHTHLRFVPASDVYDFKEAIETSDWQRAVGLYQGEFLAGIQAKGSASYQDWLEQTRHDYMLMWREACLHHSHELASQQDFQAAIACLAKVLDYDMLDEDTLQHYLGYCLQAERRMEGLQRFEAFETLLKSDIGMPPLAKTLQLVEALKAPASAPEQVGVKAVVPLSDTASDTASDIAPNTVNTAPNSVPDADSATEQADVEAILEQPPELHELHAALVPHFTTSFVGRDVELLELLALLASDARLISLIGAGGMGKTRLAIELSQQAAENFADGVAYFSLATLQDPEQLALLCLESLAVTPSINLKPEQQLLDYLRYHEHLLIFDNFEHLMPAKDIVQKILEHSPRSKIIVTSRHILNLRHEHIFQLTGLRYPRASSPELRPFNDEPSTRQGNDRESHKDYRDYEAYGAIQLFLRTAKRVKPDFYLHDDDYEALVVVMQVLEGVPLLIELAAAWLRLLSFQEILQELQQGMALLEQGFDDLAEQHQSTSIIFEHSWQLLNAQEQQALSSLAVFDGGFTKEAARHVAQVSLGSLLALVNKSLLQRNHEGRFLRHLLVRNYSYEKLMQDPERMQYIKAKHADYFCQYITVNTPARQDYVQQKQHVAMLEQDYANIEQALDFFMQHDSPKALQMAQALDAFWQWQCYFPQGQHYFAQLWQDKARLETPHDQLAVALCLATYYLSQGNTLEAEALALQAEALVKPLQDKKKLAEVYLLLCDVLYDKAEYDAVENYAKQSQALLEENDSYNQARVKRALGRVCGKRDKNFLLSYRYQEEALTILYPLQDWSGIASALYNMGNECYFMEDYAKAEQLVHQSMEIDYKCNNLAGLADDYNLLGNCLREQGRLAEAQPYYEQSYAMAKRIGDAITVGYALDNLGLIVREQGDTKQGKIYLRQALQIRHNIQMAWGIASCLHRMAGLYVAEGKVRLGVLLWGVSERLWQEMGISKPSTYLQRFARDWQQAQQNLSPQAFEAAFQQGQNTTVEQAVALALDEQRAALLPQLAGVGEKLVGGKLVEEKLVLPMEVPL